MKRARRQHAPLPESLAAHIGAPGRARAARGAHRRRPGRSAASVVHRDVAPETSFFRVGRRLLGDFGVAGGVGNVEVAG